MGYNPDNLKKIRAEYEGKHLRALSEAEERSRAVRAAIPGVGEIDAKLAQTGLDAFDLTLRKSYREKSGSREQGGESSGDGGGKSGEGSGWYAGMFDSNTNQAFGCGEWATRTEMGAVYNWMVGNALLPSNDAPYQAFTDRGIMKIDRTTALSLSSLCTAVGALDKKLADYGAGLLIGWFRDVKDKPKAAKAVLISSIVLNLLILGFFKYYDFLVGALSALLSGFYFGLGPWLPFQMLSWGLIGLFAGLFRKPLKKSLPLLCVYGAAAGALYSLMMDVFMAVWKDGGLTAKNLLLYFSASLPTTAVYLVSNVVFLLLLRKPVGNAFERVITKYGMEETE